MLPYPSVRIAIQSTALIHPNMLSSLLMQLMLALLFLPAGRDTIRPLQIGLALVLFAGIVLLQSRGVWVGMMVALLAVLSAETFLYRTKRAMIWLAAMAFVFSLTALAFVIWPEALKAVLSVFSRGQSLEDMRTLTNRLVLWHDILATSDLKQIMVGHGYALMNRQAIVDFGDGLLYGAHNAYLSVYLGAGLMSLLFLLGYFILLIVRFTRRRHHIEKPLYMLFIASAASLFTHAMAGEEFGVHLTPTFLLLFFHGQRIFDRNPSV